MMVKDPIKQLEITFKNILVNNMQDMPMINPKIAVKTVGFTLWQQYHFGVLITPWFMNLILVPQQKNDLKGKIGAVNKIQFPSGCYDFILNYEQHLGYYLSCSLFSPMFVFEDQSAAELTAIESLIAVLQSKNEYKEQNKVEEDSLSSKITTKDTQKTIQKDLLANTSRRAFIRGKVFSKVTAK